MDGVYFLCCQVVSLFTIFAHALAPPNNPCSRHHPLADAVRSIEDQREEEAGANGTLQPIEAGG